MINIIYLIKIKRNAPTAHNRTVTVRRLRRLGYTKHQSGLRPLWCFAPPQFFAPVKHFVFSLSGAKNRQLQPERYATVWKI
jgi:hypothetical protein